MRERNRLAMQALRESRRAEGYRELTFWLPDELKQRVDEQVAAGRYRTQSELLAAAVETLFKAEPTENVAR